MDILEIIEAKRDHQILTKEAIDFWITGVVKQTIPDYQSSALLMAIVLNGMNLDEITELTRAMRDSGDHLDLSAISGIKVDKHSTGGVGDKTSLVLAPLLASLGLKVPKMSGRGLGHTGGTLDKLESVPGYRIECSQDEFVRIVNHVGCSIIGQTADLVPADKILYALRDVTATVNSPALICASILSKKLAADTDCILIDVKYGDGAFMKHQEEARALGDLMRTVGTRLGRQVDYVLSDMDQPLGRTIGNALEVREAAETLLGKGPKDFTHLCVHSAGLLLVMSGLEHDVTLAQAQAQKQLDNGQAYQVFLNWLDAQGADTSVLHDLDAFTKTRYRVVVHAPKSGIIHRIHTQKLGHEAMLIGAGRMRKEDLIDPKAGLVLHVKRETKIQAGDTLIEVCSNQPVPDQVLADIRDCFEIVS